MDDRTKTVDSTEGGFESPPAAHFDEVANANAKPVQPIPTSGVAVWIQRAQYARQLFTARTKALALALVGGLAIGALGHTMLVKEASSLPDATPVVQQSNADTTATQNATNDTGLNYKSPGAQVSAMTVQSAGQASSGIRRHRNRSPLQHGQRAYRVAVIR